jgi:subfamily B ATP-binding cassette protein MsbA
MDIRQFRLRDLRAILGIVTQETILFNDSVRNNIAYGLAHVPQHRVEEAARAANAHAFIQRMEKGYDTVIGERGVKLSGGERQRLAIARALLKDPPILILDEATSSLDTESELLVQEAVDRLMENRTSFVIAHRLSTILHADKIVVLDQGRIVEEGTHRQLLGRKGLYKKLYDMQFRDQSVIRG